MFITAIRMPSTRWKCPLSTVNTDGSYLEKDTITPATNSAAQDPVSIGPQKQQTLNRVDGKNGEKGVELFTT